MASYLKSHKKGMEWYRDELLEKAKDIGYRLLPAFNTTTGMPYPRVGIVMSRTFWGPRCLNMSWCVSTSCCDVSLLVSQLCYDVACLCLGMSQLV